MLENANRTELDEFGEFGLIDHLTKNFELTNPTSKVGVGDDAAVIDTTDKQLVVTTDMLVEGVHFDMMYTPLKHLGYKAIMVNLSDVFAMNAYPKQVTVSVAISNRFSLEAVEELYNGIQLACEKYKVDLIGGDTTSSNLGLVISVTAIGEREANKIAYRSGAKENDLLVVSGDLGAAYMGLQVLEREKSVFKEAPGAQPDLTGFDYILERQLKPEARKDVVRMLEELDVVPTSMIDISDGLASEVMHLCKASKKGCQLYEEKIPIDFTTSQAADTFNIDPTIAALNGGEDYELLFTIKQEDFDKFKAHPDFSIIGHITDEESGTNLIGRGENSIPLVAQGWNAFKKKEE